MVKFRFFTMAWNFLFSLLGRDFDKPAPGKCQGIVNSFPEDLPKPKPGGGVGGAIIPERSNSAAGNMLGKCMPTEVQTSLR
jgi:hypothetical protein